MKPVLIDTHAHINFRDYKEDGDEVISRALKNGVWLINVGAQYSTSQRAVKYAQKYKRGVYAAVGLHPSHVPGGGREQAPEEPVETREFEEFDFEKYRKLAENEKVVAIGEIGLDYFDGNIPQKAKDKQKDVLLLQLELAQQTNKPVIFHCKRAYNDLLDILNMFNLTCASCPYACAPALRGTIHSFMGRWSQAEKFLDLGFYLSFNGLITYARDYDKVIKNTSLDRILLETDCPCLTPEPHQGKRNEPAYVKYVAEKIAEIKQIKFEQVAKKTTENAALLFGLKI